jgi:glycosyltransferase involved in cell wall biosynthesis
VFVGRLVPMKRVDLLLAAVAALPRDCCTAWVVGDGPLRAQLERAAAGLPVRFLGFRNQSELPALLAAADLLVLPSARDTWGLVVNEMLAAGGRALVSESAGCAGDLPAFGPAVRVFAPGGLPAALAQAVAALASGADERAVDAAREAALAWFAPTATAEALLAAVASRGAACGRSAA